MLAFHGGVLVVKVDENATVPKRLMGERMRDTVYLMQPISKRRTIRAFSLLVIICHSCMSFPTPAEPQQLRTSSRWWV